MRAYFETELGKLYHGDCLEILGGLEEAHVVNTDPPYNLNKDYGNETSDNLPEDEYWSWFGQVFGQIRKKIRDGYLYCSHSDQGLWNAKPTIEGAGFEYVQLLIWWARNGYSHALHTKTWAFRHEAILFFRIGNPESLDIKKSGMWFQSVIEAVRPQSNYKEGRYHVTQKPTKLYRTILDRTPGEVTLDPFMGSGTTALVCEDLNRRWIGIEISEKYCEIAAKRIERETRQRKLF